MYSFLAELSHFSLLGSKSKITYFSAVVLDAIKYISCLITSYKVLTDFYLWDVLLWDTDIELLHFRGFGF